MKIAVSIVMAAILLTLAGADEGSPGTLEDLELDELLLGGTLLERIERIAQESHSVHERISS